jgi:hypothetical protein
MPTQPKGQEQKPIAKPRTKANQPNEDNQVRRVLAYTTVVLTITSIIAYIVTRDILLLGTSTMAGTAAGLVFRYYFKQ